MLARDRLAANSVALFILGASIYLHCVNSFGSDKNWLLLAARMTLEGKHLYVDIFETNPPLIVWLYQLPVMLGNLTGVDDYYLQVVLTCVLIGISLALSGKLMALHPRFAGNPELQAAHTWLLAFILIFFVASLYFGDREHLFIITVMPYVLRCMPALSKAALPLRLRIGIGTFAALGFCIKPHTLIVFIAIQLLCLVRERSLRPVLRTENWIIGMAWVLYVAAIAGFFPEYFRTIIPIEILTYAAFKNDGMSVLYYFPALLSLSIAFAEFRLQHKAPYRADIFYLAALCLASFLYARANNGWIYTFYPLNCLTLLTVGWLWLEYAWLKKNAESQGNPSTSFARGACACAILLLLNFTATAFLSLYIFCMDKSQIPGENVLSGFVQLMRDNHYSSFVGMSTSFDKWPRLAKSAHASFSTRFHHLWMLPKFVVSDDAFRTKNEWVLELVAKGYAQDLNHNRPDVIFVDTSPIFAPTDKSVDILSYFSVYPDFSAAWGQYAFKERIDYCKKDSSLMIGKEFCRYDVFIRKH